MPESVIHLLVTVIRLYSLVLLARIIISWIPNLQRGHPLVEFLYSVTEPVLEPVRRAIPPLGMFDISPIIVFIGLHVIQAVLMGMAAGM